MKELASIDYKDWFINQKRIPDKNSAEHKSFFNFHKDLCIHGFMMNGVYINPFLYWHLNIWHTEVDYIDERGRISQKYANPLLRDNEWIVTNEIERAHNEKKGLVILGIRRFGKSVLEASYIGWGATFDENSQNIIAGLNSPDIKLITDKLDKGLNFIPEAWRWQRVEDNWKNQVTLGIKTRSGERIPFSQILIRNLSEGNNEEAIAGTKPRKLIIDEALHEDSLLYTTTGEIKIKDISIGQKIFGDNGHLTQIIDKIDVGIVDTYEIKLKDGRKLRASGNHIWKVYNTYLRRYIEITTDELKEKLFFEKKDNRYDKVVKSYIYSIPNNNAVDYQPKDLELDPYILGVWLGDGTSDKPNNICSVDDDIINAWELFGKRYKLTSTVTYESIKDDKFRHISLVGKKGKTNIIDRLFYNLNLVNNKHIPKEYLQSSYGQRLELLKGLMDTDGSCDNRGHIEFSTVIPQLADDFFTLCRSLGISVYRKERTPHYIHNGEKKTGKTSFRFQIFTGIRIFKLQRKIDNYNLSRRNNNSKKQMAYKQRCTIIDIQPIGKHQCYCIKVNNDSNLFLIDNFTPTHNCGKGNFLRALQAAAPGFTTPYGWACSPIVVGTGGDMTKFMDAKTLMFDADSFNFMTYRNEQDDSRKHGLFISYKYRMEAKEQSTFGSFLNKPEKSPLHNIPMLVSNEEKAKEITIKDLERLRKANDRIAYLKEKMYYPMNVDDIFLNELVNIFDTDSANRQKYRLLDQGRTGTPVVLFQDEEGHVSHSFTDKLPISNFPARQSDNKDAPVVIYEFPVANPPYGLYTAGVDPYRQGQAAYSTSLGSVYIYKRMHDLTGEKYQDMFVASYCARPDKKESWEEQARLLIKYYNARALCENDDISFIEYMKAKGDAHYLEKQPEWLMEIVPNTTVKRDYGVHRSAQKIIDYLHNCLKRYTEENIYVEKDEDGKVIKEVTGMSKILDPLLLEEIIHYNDEGNFDRIVAAELAIAQAIKMDPILGRVSGNDDARIKALFLRKSKSTLFVNSHGMFAKRKQKLFV